MALSDTQVAWLEKLFELARGNDGMLSDWDRKFLADMEERFEKYADKAYVSPSQGTQLRRIYNKLTGRDNE